MTDLENEIEEKEEIIAGEKETENEDEKREMIAKYHVIIKYPSDKVDSQDFKQKKDVANFIKENQDFEILYIFKGRKIDFGMKCVIAF